MSADTGPKLEGFYATQPSPAEGEQPIYLREIVYGLSAVIEAIHLSEVKEARELEGLTDAAHVLMSLLEARYTGEELIRAPRRRRKPAARATRRRSSAASVLSLVPKAESDGQS